MLPAYVHDNRKELASNCSPASRTKPTPNSFLQGARVILAACVVVSHLYLGVIETTLGFLGWVAVNGFFVMSGWLAYDSLNRTWLSLDHSRLDKLQSSLSRGSPTLSTLTTVSDESPFSPPHTCGSTDQNSTPQPKKDEKLPETKIRTIEPWRGRLERSRVYVRHVIEYITRRLLPFIWIIWLIVLAMKCTQTFREKVSVKRNIFSFYNSPIFNFWTVHLRTLDTGPRVYWANPPVWYISCLSLYTVIAPFAYHAIRLMKKIPIGGVQVKLSIYAILPFILMILDYFYVRVRLDQTILHSPSPHPEPQVFAIQVSPEGYANKFIIPMIANALWSDIGDFLKTLSTGAPPLAVILLSYFPVLDCLIIVQTVIWFLVPKVPRSIYWTSIYISIYLPINCLVCWAAMNNVGANFIFSRILRSRWLSRIAPDYVTLFIYLLHVPLTEIVNHRPKIREGVVSGLAILYCMCLCASQLHARVMKRYNRLMTRLFPKRTTRVEQAELKRQESEKLLFPPGWSKAAWPTPLSFVKTYNHAFASSIVGI